MNLPRVYSIDISVSFVKALAKHLLHLTESDGQRLARCTVILPSHRACRSLAHELVQQSPHGAIFLPRMMPLGDLDEEVFDLDPLYDIDLPPAISAQERHGILLGFVLKYAPLMQRYQDSPYRMTLASQLATALERLIDQVAWEGLDYAALEHLVPAEYAQHWQMTLDFLRVITQHWPEILKARGLLDLATRRRLLLEGYAQIWSKYPPEYPVIAAGSTGSIPATAQLLKVISALPQGQVILPGLDYHIAEDVWKELPITHPQYGMQQLLNLFAIDRQAVDQLPVDTSKEAEGRAHLISYALHPQFLDFCFVKKEVLEIAQKRFSYLEAKTLQEEALCIALCMREVVVTSNKQVALITPDRDLVKRVKLELKRWNYMPDDSGGESLSHTPVGRAFCLLAQLACNPMDQSCLLALLKDAVVQREQLASTVEMSALRGQPGLGKIEQIVGKLFDDGAKAALKEVFQAIQWPDHATMKVYTTLHMQALATLVADLGILEGFKELEFFILALQDVEDAYPLLSIQEYCLLIQDLVQDVVLRQPEGYHPQLLILGPLEARTQKADVMILGGLNEGCWPAQASNDPWLNRSMRSEFGLPLPERRIGLSAHDFAQAFCADEVFLTRSLKVDGAPTVPSRWLMRLQALFQAQGMHLSKDASMRYQKWAEQLMRAPAYQPCPAPAPCPPLEARPRRLSVSSIDMWMRDPYALYAKKILNLNPLDPLHYELSAREKGILTHRVLELFLQQKDESLQKLLEIAEDVFQPYMHVPLVRGYWWPRFRRVAEWFIKQPRPPASVSEVWGELTFSTALAPFTLFAKADRIDLMEDGLYIIDYKTGGIPNLQQMRGGYACQLPLEAVIARAGGFSGVKAMPVKALSVWKLSGGEPAGEVTHFQEDIAALADDALDGLKRLVEVFDKPDTVYHAQPRRKYALRFNDYAHLARIAEWDE